MVKDGGGPTESLSGSERSLGLGCEAEGQVSTIEEPHSTQDTKTRPQQQVQPA